MATLRPLRALLACVGILVLTFAMPESMFGQSGTWTLRTPPPGSPDLTSVHFFDGANGFVVGARTGTGVVYRTADSGSTWSANLIAGAPPINDLYFVPGTNFGVVVGDGNFVAVSTDRGLTWTPRPIPSSAWTTLSDLQGVFFKTPAIGFAVGLVPTTSGPRMARTIDSGKTWSVVPISASPANNLYDVDFFDYFHGAVVGTGLPTRKSTTSDGGFTWEANANMGTQPQTESVSFYGVDAIEGTPIAFAAGGKNYASPRYALVRRTTDTGATWTTLDFSSAGFTQPATDVLALSDLVVFVCGQDGAIARTTNGGTTWARENVPNIGSDDLRRLSATPDNWLWSVGTSGRILRTRVIPDVRWSPLVLDFGRHCPGWSGTMQLAVDNVGTGVLSINGYNLVEPDSSNVVYEIQQPAPAIVRPRRRGIFDVSVTVPADAHGGTHVGELRLACNDENNRGLDTFVVVELHVTVPSTSIVPDTIFSRDAGLVRVGRSLTLDMPEHLRNSSRECPARIDTAYFANGTEFRLVDPVSSVVLAPLAGHSVKVRFAPAKPCARFDTLLVFQGGEAPPVRIAYRGTGGVPTFRTDPVDTLDLGAALVGNANSGLLSLVNKRDSLCTDATQLRSFRIVGPNAADFTATLSFDPTAMAIPADGALPIPINGRPSALGTRLAYALIGHELANNPDTVVLIVRGIEADLAPFVSEIDFGIVEVGSTVDSILSGALRNIGTTPLSFASVSVVGGAAAMFAALAPAVPGTILPGDADTLAVRFAPTAAGAFSSVLQIVTSAGRRFNVLLKGIGDTASIRIGIDTFDVGRSPVMACRERLVTRYVVNAGRIPLRVRSLALDPAPFADPNDATRFSVVDPVLPPERVIMPGDSMAVTLRFCPDREGLHRALLRIVSNAPGASREEPVRATAYKARISEIDTIVFAPVRAGRSVDSLLDRLVHNGETEQISIDSIEIVGQDASDFLKLGPTLPQTVGPSAVLPVSLRFQPATAGAKQARLILSSSVGDHEIVLLGTATGPRIGVSRLPSLALRARVGRRDSTTIVLTGEGTDSARIESIASGGDPAFSLVAPGRPITLAPGDTLYVPLVFSPVRICDHLVSITLRAEGIGGRSAIGDSILVVTGIGVAPVVAGSVDTIDFGRRSMGSVADTMLPAFLVNGPSTGPQASCVDSTRMDSLVVGGTDRTRFAPFAPSAIPVALAPGGAMDLGLGMVTDRPGRFSAELLVYFDGSTDSVRRIQILGEVAAPAVPLQLTLGPDQESRPGAFVRIPIASVGAVPTPPVAALSMVISFDRSLLKPERVVMPSGRTASMTMPAVGGSRAELQVDMTDMASWTSGEAGSIEFQVLLGRVLATDVAVDTAWAPDRPDVLVGLDTAAVSIAEFCDAQGRLVRFAGGTLLKATPNPARSSLLIEYLVPAEVPVRLEIVDAAGREVAVLADGRPEPGQYSAVIDLAGFPAGSYYCVLHRGRFTDVTEIRVEK